MITDTSIIAMNNIIVIMHTYSDKLAIAIRRYIDNQHVTHALKSIKLLPGS